MNSPLKSIPGELSVGSKQYRYYSLAAAGLDAAGLARLPYSIRILLESALRHQADEDVTNLANWQPQSLERKPVAFFPGRVVMQDLSGLPAMNDMAGLRAALSRRGLDPKLANPRVPVDLVIDHSIHADFAGTPGALAANEKLEFERNAERYQFLHWCTNAFENFRVVPPSSGIVHQVNLEYLSQGVLAGTADGQAVLYPDTVVGTDSHTTMINGLGVAGWGVGGIEALAVMLGEPIEFLTPDVTGIRLSGRLPEGATPTDLTLTVVQLLRKLGVVDQFVEFCGPGLDELSLADRAMLANMAPEAGATMLYFPVDALTLEYLRFTGRDADLVETYMKAQGLFRQADSPQPEFTRLVELDLSSIEPSLAGPKRPQDRVALKNVKTSFRRALGAPLKENGYGLSADQQQKQAVHAPSGEKLGHGAVVVASITSCTNTSDPAVMLAAGLLAKKAVARGLKSKPWVKTSLAPGSGVVAKYLLQAGLMPALEALGFHLVGFGCTTCIGNSGPLAAEVVDAIRTGDLVAAAVLSGNRNFEGRVSPHTRANYLASPPLVVAYALAGTVDIDLDSDPLGTGHDGQPVYLKELWPSSTEINAAIQSSLKPEMFKRVYANLFDGNAAWNAIHSGKQALYTWNQHSSYLQEPPFFDGPLNDAGAIRGARALAWLGDSVTTDHISPAGAIKLESPAGKYLLETCEESPEEFNSYGARRGNDRVMVRGTFANIRLKNNLLPGVEGPFTRHMPSGEQMPIYDAALRYQQEGIPLVVVAGREYGSGSSRDWAAKGVLLLGVKAIIAESYERIHRSNLAGMGVLPLQFMPGENAASLGLDGSETFDIELQTGDLAPGMLVEVHARRGSKQIDFKARARLDTLREVDYYRQGGLLKAAVGWLGGAGK